MTEKYIDLHDEIADSIHWDATVADTLKWLDEHPDQVPGRTITESQIAEAFGDEYHYWAKRRLSRIGITVVPDPEPTNAEKLEALYDQWLESDAPACRVSFHQFMDDAGVKAPGGDDEH